MRLIDVVQQVQVLTQNAPYAIIGGLAQILWARKTHTDDLDLALHAPDLTDAYEKVRTGRAGEEWSLPGPLDRAHEADDVFQVYHLTYTGTVVDLIAFRFESFNKAIIESRVSVPELSGIHFIRPELLLITHLLRPGPSAALAAVELVLARQRKAAFDVDEARVWAERVGRADRLDRVLAHAKAFTLE
jgi:hypothetical protein